MAKSYQCDGCGFTQAGTHIPNGWITVIERGFPLDAESDFCGPACASEVLRTKADEREALAAAREDEFIYGGR